MWNIEMCDEKFTTIKVSWLFECFWDSREMICHLKNFTYLKLPMKFHSKQCEGMNSKLKLLFPALKAL